jgi:hypothetical protein
MLLRTPPVASLVVIEFGASWPRWLGLGDGGRSAVVAQHYEGAPASLLTQVASRVTRLETESWSLERVILVCNDRLDSAALAARSVLARGLLDRLVRRSRGELVLTVEEGGNGRVGRAVVDLAAGLERSIRGQSLQLSVRIGDRPPVHARPRPVSEASAVA